MNYTSDNMGANLDCCVCDQCKDDRPTYWIIGKIVNSGLEVRKTPNHYKTKEAAEKRAKQLADKVPDAQFVVLKIESTFEGKGG